MTAWIRCQRPGGKLARTQRPCLSPHRGVVDPAARRWRQRQVQIDLDAGAGPSDFMVVGIIEAGRRRARFEPDPVENPEGPPPIGGRHQQVDVAGRTRAGGAVELGFVSEPFEHDRPDTCVAQCGDALRRDLSEHHVAGGRHQTIATKGDGQRGRQGSCAAERKQRRQPVVAGHLDQRRIVGWQTAGVRGMLQRTQQRHQMRSFRRRCPLH